MMTVLDHLPNKEIEVGELLTVVVVNSANAVKDVFSNFKNAVGGRMKIYENLIQDAMDISLKELELKAKEKGYDGVIGIRFVSPTIAIGGAEIVAYGNGFHYKTN